MTSSYFHSVFFKHANDVGLTVFNVLQARKRYIFFAKLNNTNIIDVFSSIVFSFV